MSSLTEPRVRKLAQDIQVARPGERPIQTDLATSDRVLRRVTDGIYREPWSAIRELVSNAYDADATEVNIDTDAPRFERIVIRDNGCGFTANALALMIKSIGGSPKRTSLGAALGISDPKNPDRSPGGRKLIGKLGIGLFAVSQLTHEFQVITKRQGEASRTIADVVLFRYSESGDANREPSEEAFRAGTVRIWKVPARDRNSHGTEVILRNLLPRTKAELASLDMWTMLRAPSEEGGRDVRVQRPKYHIGLLDAAHAGEFSEAPVLPWGNAADPEERFAKLANAMYARASEAETRRPSLENTFDNYFRFLWFLSLAAPVDYLYKHPFDLDGTSGLKIYVVGNSKDEHARELKLKAGQSIREALGLRSPERGTNLRFRVVVDGVALKRPIRFTDLPKSSHSVERPLLFVGRDSPDLSKIPQAIRGGELAFEGYLLWSPRVVPVEHNGVLVRINDASGTLFDESFMKYQVSEQTRMRQVTSEIFVMEGLDAALNIDRESFNVAHPHYQYVAGWVHNAFRQFATRHKDVAKEARTKRLVSERARSDKALSRAVADIVEDLTEGDEDPVDVEFAEGLHGASGSRAKDRLVYSLETVFEGYEVGERSSAKRAADFAGAQGIMRGVVQVLYAAGVFDRMSHERQEMLLSSLARVIFHGRNS